MTKAKLVIYADGFQPAVDDATKQVDPSHLLDVAAAADLTLESTEDGHEHAGESAAQHAEHDAQHDHAGNDPHFWLDPLRYAAVARRRSGCAWPPTTPPTPPPTTRTPTPSWRS